MHPLTYPPACPDRALPRYALLRAATAGHCCMLGALPWPRARGGRRRATLECSKGVFGGCAPEGTALKWPLFYLSARDIARQ
jgi:hypothetical protein